MAAFEPSPAWLAHIAAEAAAEEAREKDQIETGLKMINGSLTPAQFINHRPLYVSALTKLLAEYRKPDTELSFLLEPGDEYLTTQQLIEKLFKFGTGGFETCFAMDEEQLYPTKKLFLNAVIMACLNDPYEIAVARASYP